MTNAAPEGAPGVVKWWMLALVGALLLLRAPSLVQPAGADQALYAYVGTRILAGGLPYQDAWDQKPPAIHFTYAALYGLWPHESVVPAADLLASGTVALMLLQLGRTMFASPATGAVSASLFLFLGDPTFNRLSGVRTRSQCETFIALAVTAAMLLVTTSRRDWLRRLEGVGSAVTTRGKRLLVLVGVLLGIAVTFKYNALVYVLPAIAVLASDWPHPRALVRRLAFVGLGISIPVLLSLVVFAAGGALSDLFYATVRYNLEYSGETYAGLTSFLVYLLTFPVAHARVDALWLVGGVGCLALVLSWLAHGRHFDLLVPVLWVAAACMSIAINGSRGLPQYFVQAAPALALAAGVAAGQLWPATWLRGRSRSIVRIVCILLVAAGAYRVTDFDKLPRNAAHDLAYLIGRIPRDEHLMRYEGAEAKYAPLSMVRLGAFLRERTTQGEAVYIFGFSPGAYLSAKRASASRFFWSRPILVGFNEGVPGYGADGLLAELEQRPPRYVVLQLHDWAPPPGDSASFFAGHKLLGPWLRARYRRVAMLDKYEVWLRSGLQEASSGPPAAALLHR